MKPGPGPWILIDSIVEGTQVAQGCLPDRSIPCLISNPDVYLMSTFSPKNIPTIVPHPEEWVAIENLANVGNSTSKTEQLRDLMQLSGQTNHLQAWCIGKMVTQLRHLHGLRVGWEEYRSHPWAFTWKHWHCPAHHLLRSAALGQKSIMKIEDVQHWSMMTKICGWAFRLTKHNSHIEIY